MTAINFAARHNVRFWTWWNNGWVKLTLRPGWDIEATLGYRHEEGWHYESSRWLYGDDNGEIRLDVVTEGCDCDGRLDQFWEGAATEYDEEFVDQDDGQAYRRLKFHKRSAGQRDYAAEAMGY